MSIAYCLSLIVAVALCLYLFVALFRPELF